MKKLTVVAMVMGLVMLSANAFAFTLNSYNENLTINFTNWDIGTIYGPGTYSGMADGDTDSFGIIRIDSIYADGNNIPIWTPTGSETITGMFYGIDDNNADILANFSGTIDSVGGFIDLYAGPNDLNVLGAAPTVEYAGLGAPTDNWNITDDGELILRLAFVPGASISDATSQYHQDVDSLAHPVRGGGNGYLMVVGGTLAGQFDSNRYDDVYPGADMDLLLTFNELNLTPAEAEAGWLVKSVGRVTGRSTPEPATMAIFGMGLAGLGVLRRKAR